MGSGLSYRLLRTWARKCPTWRPWSCHSSRCNYIPAWSAGSWCSHCWRRRTLDIPAQWWSVITRPRRHQLCHLHVLAPPEAGPETRHCAHRVRRPWPELAGLQPECPLLWPPGLGPACILPHVPVPVLQQVRLGEDVGGVKAGQEAVVLVVEAREPEAKAPTESLGTAAARAGGEGGHSGHVPDHAAVILVSRPGLGVAPGQQIVIVSLQSKKCYGYSIFYN